MVKNSKNGECLGCHGDESSALVLSVPWGLCWSVMPLSLPSTWECGGAMPVVAAAQTWEQLYFCCAVSQHDTRCPGFGQHLSFHSVTSSLAWL